MKYPLLAILLFFFLATNAQDAERKYALTTSTFAVGVGSAQIIDPYLSPFEYSGSQLKLAATSRRLLNPENTKLSYSQKGYMDLGTALHPNRNNSMLFFSANYALGIHYHLRPAERWMVLVGGSYDIGLGGKYLGRNVNNPFSLDLFTGINATAEVQTRFEVWKQPFRVQYGAQTPLLGGMFVPRQGITYYELFSLGNAGNAFHFSSLHNRQGWAHYLHLDIPMWISTFRLAVQHDYLTYTANEMVFRKNNVTVMIGYVFDMYVFRGKKRKSPPYFIHSYE